MTLDEWAVKSYKNSLTHAFWDDCPPLLENAGAYIGNKLMLIVGEVAEAHECLRDNVDPSVTWHREEDGKPEGFQYELADVLIRVFDLAGALGINLDSVVAEKSAFNAGRPVMHGKAF